MEAANVVFAAVDIFFCNLKELEMNLNKGFFDFCAFFLACLFPKKKKKNVDMIGCYIFSKFVLPGNEIFFSKKGAASVGLIFSFVILKIWIVCCNIKE